MKTVNNPADPWTSRIQLLASTLKLSELEVQARLEKWGIPTTPEGLAMLSDDDVARFGDFANVFSKDADGESHPTARLRLAFKQVRQGEGTTKRADSLKALGYQAKLEDADLETLLKAYRPELPSDPVTLVLKKRFGDEPAIAFTADGLVAIAETIGWHADREQGLVDPCAKLAAVEVEGQLEKLHPVGYNPNVNLVLEEDPLFPGHALHKGRSMQNHRNWSGVSHEARVFCRLVLSQGLLNPRNGMETLRLIELASGSDALEKLTACYPEVGIVYRQLSKEKDLPELKVRPARVKQNNPFGNRTY